MIFTLQTNFYLKAGDHDLHEMVTKCHECIFFSDMRSTVETKYGRVCVHKQGVMNGERSQVQGEHSLTHSSLLSIISIIMTDCESVIIKPWPLCENYIISCIDNSH
jgi:hypothetical protein